VRSWREDTPQAVQDDLDGLLGVALERAEHGLRERGVLHPFAAAVGDDGGLTLTMGDAGTGAPTAEVVELLYAGLRGQRDAYRAVAFVVDVRVEGGDAVRVEAEHRDGGPAIGVVMPYQRSRFRKTLATGELSAFEGQRRVWT
jgi:hypothetical protein